MATPSLAQDIVASIVSQLRRQGYGSISKQRTFLGRVRIIAERSSGRREIIVNPRTGEILRDFWQVASGEVGNSSDHRRQFRELRVR